MKTVLITGASQGIGASMALEFAKNNYNIILNYNNSEQKDFDLKEELEKNYSVKVLTIKADVSKEDEVKNMVDVAIKEFQKIDVLINNAAIAIDCDFWNKKVSDFKKILDVNLIGTFLVSKYVGKNMLNNHKGNIINIASTNGIDTTNPYSLDYDASKAGVISLTHNLAKEFAPSISVNAIAPGWVNTSPVKEMNPKIIQEEKDKILLNRFANPGEIAKVALFLASEDASYINDSIIRVDGGIKC